MARTKKIKDEDVDQKDVHVVETKVVVDEAPATFNGKKIIDVKEVEINGKVYKDITVEDGSTFRV